MINPSFERELHSQLDLLSPEQQQKVLRFAEELVRTLPEGQKGSSYLSFAGSIVKEDVVHMDKAIEDGCERVDADEW
jgi:hypothetical protein